MKAYYNEIEHFAAQWLHNLIDAGLIAPGEIDERSIEDVTPTDLAGYDRCHFFAGIAGWDRALQLAGWPAEWPVWTGSCPCQPFSSAGKGGRGADERHLWPAWFHLIRVCRPPVIFGEQVASKDGLKWLDLVCSDLEAEGYAVGAADLCAAGVGAPHIRQRLWFCAVGNSQEFNRWDFREDDRNGLGWEGRDESPSPSPALLLGHAEERGCEGNILHSVRRERDKQGSVAGVEGPSPTGELADTEYSIPSRRQSSGIIESNQERETSGFESCGAVYEVNFWHDCLWLPCRDGKWRPTKPGLSPLAHGVSGRVGKLRAIGNSIVPQVAAEFIKAVMEAMNESPL